MPAVSRDMPAIGSVSRCRSCGWIQAVASYVPATGATHHMWSMCPWVTSTATGLRRCSRTTSATPVGSVLAGVDDDALRAGSGGDHVAVGAPRPGGETCDQHGGRSCRGGFASQQVNQCSLPSPRAGLRRCTARATSRADATPYTPSVVTKKRRRRQLARASAQRQRRAPGRARGTASAAQHLAGRVPRGGRTRGVGRLDREPPLRRRLVARPGRPLDQRIRPHPGCGARRAGRAVTTPDTPPEQTPPGPGPHPEAAGAQARAAAPPAHGTRHPRADGRGRHRCGRGRGRGPRLGSRRRVGHGLRPHRGRGALGRPDARRDPEEALAFFARRYDDLLSRSTCSSSRVEAGALSPEEATASVKQGPRQRARGPGRRRPRRRWSPPRRARAGDRPASARQRRQERAQRQAGGEGRQGAHRRRGRAARRGQRLAQRRQPAARAARRVEGAPPHRQGEPTTRSGTGSRRPARRTPGAARRTSPSSTRSATAPAWSRSGWSSRPRRSPTPPSGARPPGVPRPDAAVEGRRAGAQGRRRRALEAVPRRPGHVLRRPRRGERRARPPSTPPTPRSRRRCSSRPRRCFPVTDLAGGQEGVPRHRRPLGCRRQGAARPDEGARGPDRTRRAGDPRPRGRRSGVASNPEAPPAPPTPSPSSRRRSPTSQDARLPPERPRRPTLQRQRAARPGWRSRGLTSRVASRTPRSRRAVPGRRRFPPAQTVPRDVAGRRSPVERLRRSTSPPTASQRPLLGDAVGVEDAVDRADGLEDVAEVLGVGHLEGEPALGDPVAGRRDRWPTGC